jgi:molybdate transport system substrate-binding protein
MPNPLLVAAAASLRDVLTELVPKFANAPVETTFAASGTLLQQVRAGAPIDVFLGAGTDEVQLLERERLAAPADRVALAGNRLVLIVPTGSRSDASGWDILKQPTTRRIALGMPGSVPAGRAAKATLEHRGLWASVTPRVVYGNSVRQALALVASGDADAGMVYETDALIERDRVRVVARATPGQDHPPIVYTGTVIAGRPQIVAARAFLAYLKTEPSQRLLQRFGFSRP